MTDGTTAGTARAAEPKVIRTARLELVLMTVPFMEALVRDDLEAAEVEIGASVTPWLPVQLDHFLQYRLGQLRIDPSIRPWLGRAMVLTDPDASRHVIGSIGFHGPPDEQRRLEVGYSVQPEYRRRGYAIESVRTLFDWAHRTHGISRFLASISPGNEPSLNLTAQLGFRQVGTQMDEVDGLELVFETTWPRPPGRSRSAG
jgi:RimJ/RimL family protein N-acetyltransferase